MPKIELERDPGYHRWEHRIENIFWGFLSLVLLAAILGFIGGSPGPKTEETLPGGQFSYEKFVRRGNPTSLEFKISPTSDAGFSIWIDNEFLMSADIERFIPSPTHWHVEGNGIRYQFKTESLDETLELQVNIRPEQPGTLQGVIRLNQGPEITLRQFAYP